MKDKKYPLFSNGTEYMIWNIRNCARCAKAVFYNEKKDYYPKYRCAIQKHIVEAAIMDGCGNKRDFEATCHRDCPHFTTERKRYAKKKRDTDKSLTIKF